jgi:hypothetical protein
MYWHLIKKRPTGIELFKAFFGNYKDEYYKFFQIDLMLISDAVEGVAQKEL